ncbi:MAG: CPn0927/CPn0928 family alpha/beta hydrolase fold protein [Waddliaceae bacterium]
MSSPDITVRQMLSGKHAFYERLDEYDARMVKESRYEKALSKPIYTYDTEHKDNTEHKVWRIAKDIFSFIIRLPHSLIGALVVPASLQQLFNPTYANQQRRRLNPYNEGDWNYKRISVQTDGYTIDGYIVGKTSTLANGRWVLFSNGNAEFYEDQFVSHSFKSILTSLDGNGILFNYPGVGASTGMPNRNAMAKAYRAMLNFLEDQDKGIGATEIIGYGHSIGGAVQGEALSTHKLKEGVKYVFVKHQTFSDLDTLVSQILLKPFGFLIKIFGWNMSSVESSKKLQAPEIIMQTANVETYTDISKRPDLISHDDVIPAKSSLARALLEDETCPKDNKYFMGIPEGHNSGLRDPSHLAEKIQEILTKED